MTGILAGLRIVEASAFVAAPLGGMTLAQLGADVIRLDPIGGPPDIGRWPLGPSGESLFRAGLNKGKRSIRLDLRSPAGQAVAARLVAGGGRGGGIFLTNLPGGDALSYPALRDRRADVIKVELQGNPDGSSEVDYTVNAAMGWPMATGPRGGAGPTNAVLPAWDIAMGNLAALGILAADRHRLLTGEGSHVRLALSDVALAATSALGRLAQAEGGDEAAPDGNFLYGAFGTDFPLRDGRRVMVVALTARQWRALVAATGLDAGTLAAATGADLDAEGGRFRARDAIAAALAPWFLHRDLAQVRSALDAARACWSPYQTFGQLMAEDPRASPSNPLLAIVHQPGAGTLRMAASPLRFSSAEPAAPRPSPRPGQHTGDILGEAGYTDGEVSDLLDRGVVAGEREARADASLDPPQREP